MEKAQDFQVTNLIKNTVREKVGPGFFWSTFCLVLFVCFRDPIRECEKTTPKQKSRSCQGHCVNLSSLYPTQGQHRKVQHWGNAETRISHGLSASHLAALPASFITGSMAGSWLILQPHSLKTAMCRASEESHKDDIHPSKLSPRSQKQTGTYEGVFLPDDAWTQPKG